MQIERSLMQICVVLPALVTIATAFRTKGICGWRWQEECLGEFLTVGLTTVVRIYPRTVRLPMHGLR